MEADELNKKAFGRSVSENNDNLQEEENKLKWKGPVADFRRSDGPNHRAIFHISFLLPITLIYIKIV